MSATRASRDFFDDLVLYVAADDETRRYGWGGDLMPADWWVVHLLVKLAAWAVDNIPHLVRDAALVKALEALGKQLLRDMQKRGEAPRAPNDEAAHFSQPQLVEASKLSELIRRFAALLDKMPRNEWAKVARGERVSYATTVDWDSKGRSKGVTVVPVRKKTSRRSSLDAGNLEFPDVAISPENFQLTAREERQLFAAVKAVLPPRTTVGPPIEMGGKGVREVFETINVYLPSGVFVVAITPPLINALRKRFKKSNRPKKVKFIYGPDGKVMQSVTLREQEGKTRVWRRHSTRAKGRRPRGRRGR